MCLAAPTNFAGFAAIRFLLGFAEGAVSPSFITITSVWYRKSEHATRTALWITMNGLAQIAGCLLMYGIGKPTSTTSHSLSPWRILFLVCGALTIAAGIPFYIFMPNGPRDAWFLTDRQKHILSLRMLEDREGGDRKDFSLPQLKEALRDFKAWFVFAFGVLVTMQSPVLTVREILTSYLPVCRNFIELLTDWEKNPSRKVRLPSHPILRLHTPPNNPLHRPIRRNTNRHALDRRLRLHSPPQKSHSRNSSNHPAAFNRQHLPPKTPPPTRELLGNHSRGVDFLLHYSSLVDLIESDGFEY
ncbi:uncharacterized protein RCC_04197 [Ramularia collo-cygni]|uniref:Major facilitator superfamily (MFS) profile domain-containing protein n=1 Tax=Ramularia collo-cygni TaxID=112498 RepID=A0A2D3VCV4_9PEZI|nr:uncharacterized protein RCC_04197 [Ramularia collo-cygni]CZT18353.1 uncharacterized protein RCC_04197 [Ramularia collo-cygni]